MPCGTVHAVAGVLEAVPATSCQAQALGGGMREDFEKSYFVSQLHPDTTLTPFSMFELILLFV